MSWGPFSVARPLSGRHTAPRWALGVHGLAKAEFVFSRQDAGPSLAPRLRNSLRKGARGSGGGRADRRDCVPASQAAGARPLRTRRRRARKIPRDPEVHLSISVGTGRIHQGRTCCVLQDIARPEIPVNQGGWGVRREKLLEPVEHPLIQASSGRGHLAPFFELVHQGAQTPVAIEIGPGVTPSVVLAGQAAVGGRGEAKTGGGLAMNGGEAAAKSLVVRRPPRPRARYSRIKNAGSAPEGSAAAITRGTLTSELAERSASSP